MSELKKQGTAAFIWDFLGKLSSQSVGFVVTIILARLLEPSDFGLIAMIMIVVGIAQIFTDIGLGGALIQRETVTQTHYSSVFYFNLTIATLLFLLTFFSASNIAKFYNIEQLVPLIEVVSFLFIFNALGSVQTVKLRKQLNYALITKAGLIATILSGAIGVTLALCGFGVWSLLAQVLSQSISNTILLWLFSGWRPNFLFSLLSLKQLWSFGFRMFLSGLLDALFSRLDYLIIGKLFPAATLGYFQRAKQFNLLVVQYTAGSLMSVLFPVLSQVQNDLPRFQNIILNALHMLSLITFFLLGGLYLLSEELIVFLFSDKWLPSVHFMELLLLSGFSYPLSALLVNVLSSRGNSKAFLRLEVMKKIVHSVNFVNAIYFGIESYLYGLVFVSMLGISLNIMFAANEIKLPSINFYKPIVVQMVLCCFVVYLVLEMEALWNFGYILGFFAKGTVFAVLFIGLNFFFKTKSLNVTHNKISPFLEKKFGKKNCY